MPQKGIYILKKFIAIAILVLATTFIEIYWSMGTFSEKMSSGCLDCTFSQDIIFISSFTSIFFAIVSLLLSFIKNIYAKAIIKFIILILVWFFFNYSIFVDRESSWSTYTFNEELHYTFSLSIFPILVLSIPVIFSIHYISRIIKIP